MLFSIVLRYVFVFSFWAVTLFFIDVKVTYVDGLKIEFNGWGTRLENFIKGRGE